MSEALTTADGRPLKESLAIAERQKRIRALLLVTPLFLFIFMSFLYPIALMLYRSAVTLTSTVIMRLQPPRPVNM